MWTGEETSHGAKSRKLLSHVWTGEDTSHGAETPATERYT
jgi:hypothetical protein